MREFDLMRPNDKDPCFSGGYSGYVVTQKLKGLNINELACNHIAPTSEREVVTVVTESRAGCNHCNHHREAGVTGSGNGFIEPLQQLSDLVTTVTTVTTCPARIGARIVQMIPNRPRELPPEELFRDHAQRRFEIEAHVAELAALKGWMADEFGRVRGWRQSRSGFDVAVLAAGKMNSGGRRSYYGWPHKFSDHRCYFRWPDRRAAAVVGQPYALTADTRRDAEHWAAANGLRVSFPTDFPSWWYPGHSTLVLFEPASAVR